MEKMNNNITEDYVSFELAKVLKDNGFKVKTNNYFSKHLYDKKYSEYHGFDDEYWGDNYYYDWNSHGEPFKPFNKDCYSRPTLSVVQKWVYENFNLLISVKSGIYGLKFYIQEGYYKDWAKGYPDNDFINLEEEMESENYFESPQEAIEEGLLYTLNNLL
jgi:hypothetical protein